MNNAQTGRSTAIGMLIALYLPDSQDYELTFRHPGGIDGNANGIADNIRKLTQLGRTARWQSAIDRWARMVLESAGNLQSLRWAFLQGAVYASHAVE